MKIPKPRKKKQAKLLFTRMGWWILEQKFLYYEAGKHKMVNPVPDETYDKIEHVYKLLAKKLGLKPTACEHVGFPFDTPSGRLVSEYIIKNGRGAIKEFKLS
jgi:hypothetical protein